MGLCAMNDDRTKNNRKTQKLNSLITEETKEETEPQKNIDLGKERIINRLSERTKFTDINNDYIISERILGKGATGIVREGQDKKENKKYAIKTVWKADIEQNECFKKEIDISLELNHETIVKCIDIYEDNTSIHLVLEEITGGDLFDHIIHSEDRKLKETEAIDLLFQMLEGLHYLHDEIGIVHRDIKPENFLIYNDSNTHKNRIKLIDFGFATYCRNGETMNEQLGTPQYAAPEIFERKPYTNKVDMWSVGVVLYNMVKGTQPFSNGEIENVKNQVLNKEINFNGFLNKDLKQLCQSLLERDPDKRFTAFQAINALKLIKPISATAATNYVAFKPDNIEMIMSVLYNDRTIIEELKNIFLTECSADELNKMFDEILKKKSKDKAAETETNYGMACQKVYMRAEELIDYAQNSTISPENLKIRLKKYCECDKKIIEKIKTQMINIDSFFTTLIESIIFIRKTRCLNEFTKMDKNNMGWLSVRQVNNYFIDPIKRHNIKTKLNPSDKIEFEMFYKIFNEYNGIKNFKFNKKTA